MTFSRLLALLPLTALAALPCQAHAAEPAACTARVAPGQDLQQAIDALPETDQAVTLCLDKGEFPLKGLVSIQRDKLTLRGSGKQTVLRMRDGIQQPLLVIGDYLHQAPERVIQHVAVEDLSLVGGQADNEFMPERPYLSNSAVVVRKGRDIRLSLLSASHCRSACLLTEQDTRGVVIDHNDVSGAAWDGVSFNSTSQVLLVDNDIHDNVAAGMTAEHITDSQIRDNRFVDNGSQGIYLSNSTGNQFSGNTFTGNHLAGVFLTCAIRYRNADGSTQCWDNSMSQDNVFAANRFDNTPHTYTIGVDNAANCRSDGFKPNLWRSDNQAAVSGVDLDPQRYGDCVRHEPAPATSS